ncbi:MAG: alpha/beta hydrolase [Rhodocyclaceae bacterium]|nr:alpha/beta hydrolase [Rhodocyclaceae bacterium]
MTTVVFAHGWGYDAHLWDEVMRRLADPDTAIALDFGYFGAEKLPLSCPQPVLAVGHSLGALWWLAVAPIPWRRLLMINGFPRFLADDDYPGVAGRLLARMRKRFVEAPLATLSEFQLRCGQEGPRHAMDVTRLAAGLAALAEWDARAQLSRRAHDIWAISAEHDPIVPIALSRAAFAVLPPAHVEFLPTGSHLLPLTHAPLIADRIAALK